MKTLRTLTMVLLITVIAILELSCSGATGLQGPIGPAGPAGVSITGASVNSAGQLVLTLSNGQTIDAGNVIGPRGPSGTSLDFTVSYASIVPQIEPAIVRIDVTLSNGIASGSGTIIDNRGYIITNAHVISAGQNILVTLKDGTTFNATVIASDTNQDLAILKLTTTRADFPVVSLGTMADVLVGESVIAAGFPAGTDLPGPATFTSGIVSASRTYDGSNYIQTDAPINLGSSRGCLVTPSGKMIGIPAAIIAPSRQDFENINLAIPIDQVSAFIAQFVK